jgi:hypothetical protein
MSGTYRDDQNVTIEATDNEELAKQHGLTRFDKASGQWTRPTPPDAGERDSGELAQLRRENERLNEELTALAAENDDLKAYVAANAQQDAQQGSQQDGEADASQTPPGFEPAQQDGQQQTSPGRKATGRK